MRKHFTVSVLLTLLSISLSPALAQVLAPATAPDPAAVERRVDSLLGQMTLEEKIDLLGGVDGFFIRGISRLSLPRIKKRSEEHTSELQSLTNLVCRLL